MVSVTLRVICGVVAARLRVVGLQRGQHRIGFLQDLADARILRGAFELAGEFADAHQGRFEIGRHLVVGDQPADDTFAALDPLRDAGSRGQRLLQRPGRIADALGDGRDGDHGLLHLVQDGQDLGAHLVDHLAQRVGRRARSLWAVTTA